MSYEAWGDGDDGPSWKDDAIENGWWDPDDISQAFKDTWLECERQVAEEGWTPEHDDQHRKGELAMAAAAYAISDKTRSDGRCPYLALLWPWSPGWWKPKDRRRDLVRAAALLIKEIERLDRAEKAGAK